jgi:hypothetical protein
MINNGCSVRVCVRYGKFRSFEPMAVLHDTALIPMTRELHFWAESYCLEPETTEYDIPVILIVTRDHPPLLAASVLNPGNAALVRWFLP